MFYSDWLIIVLVIFHILIAGITIYNYFTAPRVGLLPGNNFTDAVSILIPARNEEQNIKRCISSLLNQGFDNYEIIVYDDQSDDKTAETVKFYTAGNKKIKLISGNELPSGWLGKNYACSRLAEEAKSDLFMFIDTDVFFTAGAFRSVMNMYSKYKVSMLSVFSTQLFSTRLQNLTLPLVNWLLLSFLPLKKVYSSRHRKYVAANGQLILISREAYYKSGGHEKIKAEKVEDMELAKNVKALGYKIVTALGNNMVLCRMYNNFSNSFKGFYKNLYPGFRMHPLLFLIFLAVIEILFLLPFILVWMQLSYLAVIFLIFVQRLLVSALSNQEPAFNIFLHPFQMIIFFLIGAGSVISSHRKKLVWKGRTL